MTDVQASQLGALALGGGNDLNLSQFGLMLLGAQPAEGINVSQMAGLVLTGTASRVQASQQALLVLALGAPTYKRARAWSFTLDNHDFYCLRIGEYETLLFDLLTGQWAVWNTDTRSTWRAHLGQNWLGVRKPNFLGGVNTNVIAGDDTYGVLWTLAPNVGVDDPPLDGQEPQYFERVVTAGVPMFMRNSPRQSAVFLTLQLGEPLPAATDIELFLSDDQGNTFTSAGAVTINPGDYTQEVMWRSLGLIRSPGRLMEFRDRGAATALYSLNTRVSPGGAYNTDEQ